ITAAAGSVVLCVESDAAVPIGSPCCVDSTARPFDLELSSPNQPEFRRSPKRIRLPTPTTTMIVAISVLHGRGDGSWIGRGITKSRRHDPVDSDELVGPESEDSSSDARFGSDDAASITVRPLATFRSGEYCWVTGV